MASQTVTVFGGTGFLGSAIVRELANAGKRVRVATRHPQLPANVVSSDAIELVTADIRDDDSIANALDGTTGAVNAVGLYTEPSHSETFDIVHAQGAARVARQARKAGLQYLVHISGIGADANSASSYIRARAHGEQGVREAFPSAVILRPSVLFGPHDAFLGALVMLSRFPVVPLFGRGDTRLQPVHVDDVARAVSRILDGVAPDVRLLELGGAGSYRYREIVEMVLKRLGCRRPLISIPFPAWLALARLVAWLPSPPLTHNQVMLMREDKVVGPNVGSFADLGIAPRSLEEMLPACLPFR
ncbi:3-beta-hydroxy-Delta(5)-steroid dehydrogenase [Litchfieldella qijiaojingensis]|uniref:3-beta-hydroxy-Delta(5)-steroid dehydrogenase n=1 Tax=Litchfieldella qijiaojingensis TaxID=980347 RepID=A0ABQ2YVF6_9GAMM|nr:complex I NDUFA9 subunit family protein [Halomonas qijiaojingensis]GGX93467.1 3-beta-hydroxy-Delta(5)-steroid dehydrogenase [Halomonas qijiaojingensis]